MKISKVEIQAFRAYDELKDCTFDFTLPDGNTADFISLYAPNGFGKTSFYDAIEWGITANIYRFVRQATRTKNYASDEKHLNYELANKKSPQFILRNKQSAPETDSFVKVHLLNKQVSKDRFLPKGRVDSTDYHFDEKKTEQMKFRDVILSQDSIDSFLKEDDPAERYEKFMSLFGDADLNRIYTNVLCLIKANENQIEELQNEKTKLQAELPIDVDNQVLEKINIRIHALIQKGVEIEPVSADYSENDFLDFSNQIADLSITIQGEIVGIKDRLDNILEQQLRTDEYRLVKTRIAKDNERLTALKALLGRFSELSKARNLMAHAVVSLNQAAAEHQEAEEVLRQFPRYLSILDNVHEQIQEIDAQKLKMVNAEKELAAITNALTTARSEINQINGLLFNLRQQQADLPGIERLSLALTAEIKELIAQINILLNDIDSNEREATQNAELQRQYTALVESVNRNEFNSISVENSEVGNRIVDIKQLEEQLNRLNSDLKAVEERIYSQTSLNTELRQLVVLSSAYVSKTNTDSCPVCSHKYDNYQQLSERIANNPLLEQLLQDQIAAKNNLTAAITEKANNVSDLKKEILEILNGELANLKSTGTRLSLAKGQLTGRRDGLRGRLQEVETKQRESFIRINGESFSSYSESLQQQIVQQLASADKKATEIAEIQKSLEKQRVFIETWRKSIQTIETIIRSYRLDEEYINVDQFLRKKGYTNFGLEQMKDLVGGLRLILDVAIEQERQVSDQIRSLSEELKSYNEIKLNADVEALQHQLVQNRDAIKGFEHFVKQLLPSGQQNIEGQEIQILQNAEKEAQTRLEELQSRIEELEKVEGFKNNVMPLLRFMAGQQKIETLSRRLVFLTEKVRERIGQEKNRLAAIIDGQIQSFFYEDLINQLYQKIDPHPNYKTIKFRCDFNDTKPKLNVFVAGSEDEYIIPNLYFSTAQTNILSLSIFLAKALNARDDQDEPINCIFIDDPIQSLDSINILSTIDLIRSLVVNFNKQIILSTHDENFHNLLQKKMPSGKFNSKFLELETFGKVKA